MYWRNKFRRFLTKCCHSCGVFTVHRQFQESILHPYSSSNLFLFLNAATLRKSHGTIFCPDFSTVLRIGDPSAFFLCFYTLFPQLRKLHPHFTLVDEMIKLFFTTFKKSLTQGYGRWAKPFIIKLNHYFEIVWRIYEDRFWF